jgi:hypothetical protein
MDVIRLIEDLERLQLKLQIEAEMSGDAALSKRLADLALETNDAVLTAKSLPERSNRERDPALS